ncbi:MAG TPA: class I SAM-dependent methyltransferase [Burkholderiales bacterium]
MTSADRERWDRKYAAGNPSPAPAPNPLLARFAHLLDGRGVALDVACGIGQNAIALAARGYRVLGVDGSRRALEHARAAIAERGLAVQLVHADLDTFALAPDACALIAVFRYLDRRLFVRLREWLAPGGLLLYETFNVNQRRVAPQMNPDYLLAPGELARAFEDFQTIGTNDAPANTSALTYWVGRRPR